DRAATLLQPFESVPGYDQDGCHGDCRDNQPAPISHVVPPPIIATAVAPVGSATCHDVAFSNDCTMHRLRCQRIARCFSSFRVSDAQGRPATRDSIDDSGGDKDL